VLGGRVDSELHVCVSDAALSRDIFPHDYHCLGDNENRPVKWLAFEALVTRNFSTASDMVCTDLHFTHAAFRYFHATSLFAFLRLVA